MIPKSLYIRQTLRPSIFRHQLMVHMFWLMTVMIRIILWRVHFPGFSQAVPFRGSRHHHLFASLANFQKSRMWHPSHAHSRSSPSLNTRNRVFEDQTLFWIYRVFSLIQVLRVVDSLQSKKESIRGWFPWFICFGHILAKHATCFREGADDVEKMAGLDAEVYPPDRTSESEMNRRWRMLRKVRREFRNAEENLAFLKKSLLRFDFDIELIEWYW